MEPGWSPKSNDLLIFGFVLNLPGGRPVLIAAAAVTIAIVQVVPSLLDLLAGVLALVGHLRAAPLKGCKAPRSN